MIMTIKLVKKLGSRTLEAKLNPNLSIMEVCMVLKKMRELGWKVKESKLGELI